MTGGDVAALGESFGIASFFVHDHRRSAGSFGLGDRHPSAHRQGTDDLVEGIEHGGRKVNVDTDLRMASTGATRRYLAENPKDFDPRKFLAATTKAMKEICKARFEAFGSAGQAGKIKAVSLEAIAVKYAKGELKAIVK